MMTSALPLLNLTKKCRWAEREKQPSMHTCAIVIIIAVVHRVIRD